MTKTYDSGLLSGERHLPIADLQTRGAKAASALEDAGIGEGDAIAVLLRNDFPFFEAVIATNLLGAYVVPVNWHFKEEEVEYVLKDCEAKLLLVHADLLPAIANGIPEHVAVRVVETPPEVAAAYTIPAEACAPPSGTTEWEGWIAGFAPWGGEPRPSRANVIYTSGTTGKPKGVVRDPGNAKSAEGMAKMVETIFDMRPGEPVRTVLTGPVYHSAPNVYAIFAARTGGLVVIQPRFDPEGLLALIEQHKITHLHMVPTMFVRLLKISEEAKRAHDLSTLKFVVHAAAPCPPQVKREMIEWWGPVINEYYGGTETGGAIFHTSEEALKKPGTVGRPIPGAEVKILDADGNELGPNGVGEIFLRIHGFPDFTYKNLDAKRREVEKQGLVSIGDIGYLDADGYLFICDRVRDMVIFGGTNIYPAEIEGVLVGHPGVRDCAVFGIPDPEFGERLCAHVERQPGADTGAEDIRAYLSEHLASYKIPKDIVFDDALPREDSGKIMKRKIRDRYWEGAERRI